MNKENKENYLGHGIVIGLCYGVGMFLLAWNKDSILTLIGFPFFIIAYLDHIQILNLIRKNTK